MKGVPISDEIKEEVLRLYALGKTYEEIHAATGASPAAISAILKAKAKEDPDLQAVHEVAKYLREHNKAAESLQRAITFDERVEGVGSGFDELESLLPLKKKYGDKLTEHFQKADAYDKLVEETGYTHQQLMAEHRRTASELGAMKKEVTALESRVADLNGEVETLTPRLAHLKDLEAINASLKRVGRNVTEAANTVASCEWYLKMGLDQKVMDAVVAELSKKGFKGIDGLKRIGELVERYVGLEEAAAQEVKLVDSLKAESTRLTSNRSYLTEKVAALDGQCKDLEARRERLANDADKQEIRFRERRTELEQKLSSVENDFKSSSARLRELQSQIIGLDSQVTEKTAEIGRLGSQKASELKALSDLEEEKQAVLRDYSAASRSLTELQNQLDDLKRTHKEFVAERNRTVTDYGNKIAGLKGELEALENTKSEVEKVLAKCKETLDKIDDVIAGKQNLVALVSLLNDPKTPLKPKDLLEPIVSAFKAVRDYVYNRSGEIPGSRELVAALDQAIRLMGDALRIASR